MLNIAGNIYTCSEGSNQNDEIRKPNKELRIVNRKGKLVIIVADVSNRNSKRINDQVCRQVSSVWQPDQIYIKNQKSIDFLNTNDNLLENKMQKNVIQ